MARIKLQLPSNFSFKMELTVRVGDINYGNHLSNDAYLRYMQEARMQYFAQYGFTELNFAGSSVIMGDVAIVYKQQCFYNENITIEVVAAEFGLRSFDLYYRFTKTSNGSLVCEAKTGMVCFDYNKGISVNVPDIVKTLMLGAR